MRVLVSGHSGHVGGAIAAHLASRGYDVVGVSRHHAAGLDAATQITVDLADRGASEALHDSVAPCEAIVHAAARISGQNDDQAIVLTNCLGTQSLLKVAATWRCSRFVYLSSVPVIGVPLELPVTEEHLVAPPTAYHASKLFGEQLVSLATPSVLGTSLRITSPVGPGMPENRILAVFIRRALDGQPLLVAGAGTRGQNYVDVRDVAAAVEASLGRSISGTFNVASDRWISNMDLAQLCVRVLGSTSPIDLSGAADPEDGRVWDVSIAKARKLLDYAPRFTLEQSIAAVAAGHSRVS